MDQVMGMVVALEREQEEADGLPGALDLGQVLEGLVLGPTSDRGLVPAMVAIMAAARLVPVLIGVEAGPGLVQAMVVGAVAALAKEAVAIDSVKCSAKWMLDDFFRLFKINLFILFVSSLLVYFLNYSSQ